MDAKNKERRQSTSCGGVVWREREGQLHVLLIKQFPHKERWGMPKGHMHPGETLEECAMREIAEETGVHVTLGARLQDVKTAYRDEDKTVVSYLAQATGADEPQHDDPNSEVADARWFDVQELPELYAYQKPVIDGAITFLQHLRRPTV